jgi:hypothetical protein
MFDPGFDFFIDVAGYGGVACLLSSKTGSDLLGSEPSMVQADAAPLRLYFRRRAAAAGGVSTAEQLAAGTLVFAGKHVDDLGAATLLFSASSFVLTGEGDDVHYLGTLALTDAAIGTKMGTGKTLSVRVDVEWTSTDGTKRLTWQFDAIIRRQVYAGEADPTPGTPTYPHPDLLVTKIRGTAAIASGASSVVVSGLGLGAAPAQVLPGLRKPTAGAPQIGGSVLDDTVTADGFSFELDAAAPSAGYKLDYLIIL